MAFTQQRLFMNTVTLVFVFTEEMQRLHVVVLSAEVNYAREMWACHFWQALEVGLLLTFLVSMKAKVRLYQTCVSILGVYT